MFVVDFVQESEQTMQAVDDDRKLYLQVRGGEGQSDVTDFKPVPPNERCKAISFFYFSFFQ